MHFDIVGPPARRDPVADHARHYRPADVRRVVTQAKTAIALVDLYLEAAEARKTYGGWTPHWVPDKEAKGALYAVNHILARKRRQP